MTAFTSTRSTLQETRALPDFEDIAIDDTASIHSEEEEEDLKKDKNIKAKVKKSVPSKSNQKKSIKK